MIHYFQVTIHEFTCLVFYIESQTTPPKVLVAFFVIQCGNLVILYFSLTLSFMLEVLTNAIEHIIKVEYMLCSISSP